MASRKVVFMSSSIKPLYLMFPEIAQTLQPWAFSLPIDAYQSAPFLIILGTVAQVSALFNTVGLPHNPLLQECGGCAFGKGRLPSTASINAVDSPLINASSPSCTRKLMLKSVPRILSPRKPRSRACSIAMFSRLTAIA